MNTDFDVYQQMMEESHYYRAVDSFIDIGVSHGWYNALFEMLYRVPVHERVLVKKALKKIVNHDDN